MSSPIRVQRKRVKGWKMPENTVSVCRPGKWGNPFTLAAFYASHNATTTAQQAKWRGHFNGAARDAFADYMHEMARQNPHEYIAFLSPLRGKNLACFCPLDAPCHADVLLELANPSQP